MDKSTINELSPQPSALRDAYANMDDLAEQLDFKPATTVQDSVQRFVDWYRVYYKF